MSRLEVLKLVAHLIITLVLILGYILLVYLKGYSDETLKAAIMAIIGYWFGAIVPKGKGGGNGEK